jgi:hypothetical protein
MGDIVCPVCREPWDVYTVRHWRDELGTDQSIQRGIELLRSGKGCPGCLGQRAPTSAGMEDYLSSVEESGDDDPESLVRF